MPGNECNGNFQKLKIKRPTKFITPSCTVYSTIERRFSTKSSGLFHRSGKKYLCEQQLSTENVHKDSGGFVWQT